MRFYQTLKKGVASLMITLLLSMSVAPSLVTVPHAAASKAPADVVLMQLNSTVMAIVVLSALIYADTINMIFTMTNPLYVFKGGSLNDLCTGTVSDAGKKLEVECTNDEAVAKPFDMEIPVGLAPGVTSLDALTLLTLTWTLTSLNYPNVNTSGTVEGTYTPTEEERAALDVSDAADEAAADVVAEAEGTERDASDSGSQTVSSVSSLFTLTNFTLLVIVLVVILLAVRARRKM